MNMQGVLTLLIFNTVESVVIFLGEIDRSVDIVDSIGLRYLIYITGI